MRWQLLTALAARGRAGEEQIDAEGRNDRTIAGQERAAAARAAMPTAEAKQAAWELAVLKPDTPNETQRSIAMAFGQHDQDAVTAPFVPAYLEAAEDLFERLGTQRASTALETLFPRQLASPELLAQVDAWLADTGADPAALRYVQEGRADVVRALAAQALDAGHRR